jgi:hypothetical protein
MKKLFTLLLLLMAAVSFSQVIDVPVSNTDSLVRIVISKVAKTVVTPIPPVPVDSVYKLSYFNGFDKPADLTTDNGQYGNGKIITTDFVTGPGCFQSRPKTNVSGSTRSEWQGTKPEQNPVEGKIEYDVKYLYVVDGQCTSLQWHPNTPGGSASPGLWHEDGKFTWYNWKPIPGTGGGGNYLVAKQFMTIPANTWLHVKIEFKFGAAGYLRHWINGNKVVDYTGQLGDGSGQYQKVGFNGGFDGNNTEALKSNILYDNFAVYKRVL